MKKTTASDPRIGITHNRALCCECGTLRLVSSSYHGRNRVGMGLSAEHIARCRHMNPEWYDAKVAGERQLCDLKCVTCGSETRHALLLDVDPYGWRDANEDQDYGRDRPIALLNLRRWLADRGIDPRTL